MGIGLQVSKTVVVLDRSFLKRRWKFNRTPLARAGAYTMRVSRKLIRRRMNRNLHSAPGTAPYSHVPGSLPPFKMIFFVPDTFHMRVFVGMVGFGGAGAPVPGLQEHGGHATRKVFKKVGHRRLKRNFKNPRQGGVITRKVSQGVNYPERPFMRPALMVTLPKLPQFWKNSLTF